MMHPVISIGKQNFASLRENNCFYIDKSDLIREWWESQDEITRITRPRRFGKTLNMSMLNYFFSNLYTDKKKLFEDLSIWKEEKYQKLQGTYPVIFISFAAIKGADYQDARDGIIMAINATFKTNPYLERAMMTGITRVSKESVFSDLNNLNVVTTTSAEYESSFGFTEEEVFHALETMGMSEEKQLDQDENAIWSLMLASGYLKATDVEYRGVLREPWYHLMITNLETTAMFSNLFK